MGFFCDPECRGGGEGVWIRALKTGVQAERQRTLGMVQRTYAGIIYVGTACRHNIWITFRNSERPTLSPDKEAVFLRLVPKVVVVGAWAAGRNFAGYPGRPCPKSAGKREH